MRAKRLFDCCVALISLIVLSPFLAALALWIKLDSPGSVFYRGVRVGKNGHPFRIYKFRTMIQDAAQRGAGITTRGDPRITHVGSILRRAKLDELPQLLNVAAGEMSLVGPRPEDPRYVALYTPAQREVLTVPPGVTGIASLAFRHEEALLAGEGWERVYVEHVMPRKLELELAYLRRRTFGSDLQLLAETFLALFAPAPDPPAPSSERL